MHACALIASGRCMQRASATQGHELALRRQWGCLQAAGLGRRMLQSMPGLANAMGCMLNSNYCLFLSILPQRELGRNRCPCSVQRCGRDAQAGLGGRRHAYIPKRGLI